MIINADSLHELNIALPFSIFSAFSYTTKIKCELPDPLKDQRLTPTSDSLLHLNDDEFNNFLATWNIQTRSQIYTDIRSKLLRDYNIEIGGGLGDLRGKIWRIGLMGENARESIVFTLLSAIDI